MKPQRLEQSGLATRFRFAFPAGCALLSLALLAASCRKLPEDEAKLAGLTPADLPQITADIFKPMDGGIALSAEEITGRNTWTKARMVFRSFRARI